MRKYRKQEHVENYIKSTYVGDTYFKDVYLEHNALPEINFNEIDTSVEFIGKKIGFPLMINAMTGGSDFSEELNRELSIVAKTFNLPMAVGSQTIALEDEDAASSFKIVREILEDSLVISNLSAFCTVEEAKRAIDLINADALQIHINPAQEMAMYEGDRDFTGLSKNIEALVKNLEVPLIVKEVGFGISKDVAERLYNLGVRNIDVSGYGGTNFFEVENLRYPDKDYTDLFSWGIPTALSLVEVNKLKKDDLNIIAAGGIKDATDVVKALALGSNMVAICGELLNYLVRGNCEYCLEFLESIIYKTKILMLLTGCKTIEDVTNLDYKLTGRLRELAE